MVFPSVSVSQHVCMYIIYTHILYSYSYQCFLRFFSYQLISTYIKIGNLSRHFIKIQVIIPYSIMSLSIITSNIQRLNSNIQAMLPNVSQINSFLLCLKYQNFQSTFNTRAHAPIILVTFQYPSISATAYIEVSLNKDMYKQLLKNTPVGNRIKLVKSYKYHSEIKKIHMELT